MEKEKILEIEIIKINDKYSVFYPTKLDIKELEKIGYTVTEFDVLDEVEKPAINFYFDKENNFTILLNVTSLNVPFIIENIYIKELQNGVEKYNEKYGIPKRFKPENCEEYYFIPSDGYVISKLNYMTTEDKSRYDLGNCFETEEEAEKVKEELDKFWAKVRAGEIKFRAWLKEKKIMVEVSEINFIFNRVEYVVNKIKNLVYTQSDKLEKFVLMQYTGIKDKNGKEIYEGDIISTGNGFYYYEIIFENGSFKAKWKVYNLELDLNKIVRFCEIAGNIYENPELLGEKE